MAMRTLALSLLLAASGCSSHAKIWVYEPPTAEIAFQGPASEKVSRKEMLKKTIDDLALSNIFDSLFVDDFRFVVYELKIKRSKIIGSFTSGLNKIDFFISPRTYYSAMLSEGRYLDMQKLLILVGSHELSHSFWEKNLTESQKDTFRVKAKAHFYTCTKINHFAGNKFASADLCASHGLTLENYFNLKRWVDTESFYRKWYSAKNFDNYFFGTEAFAYLQEGQVEALLPHAPLESQILGANSTGKNIWKLFKIPNDLQEYYQRFFHENFFSKP